MIKFIEYNYKINKKYIGIKIKKKKKIEYKEMSLK